MLKLLSYLWEEGTYTQMDACPDLDEDHRGLPVVTDVPCRGADCSACARVCPTEAITVAPDKPSLVLDLGACIGCGLCMDICSTGTIGENRSTRTATVRREDLLLSNDKTLLPAASTGEKVVEKRSNLLNHSLHARVVSTGCSACDMEVNVSGNPVFDRERFGVHIVASPRFADALLITGPVSKSMQGPLKSCYEAMAAPRAVVAVGTCAISGGVHKGGYAEANGAGAVLPVDVFIPGCPPHPWSIIHGLLVAMNRMAPMKKETVAYGGKK